MFQRSQENIENFKMSREDYRAMTPAEIQAQREKAQQKMDAEKRQTLRASAEKAKTQKKQQERREAEMRDRLRTNTATASSSGSSGPSVPTLQQIWDRLEPLYLNNVMTLNDIYFYEGLAHTGAKPWQSYNTLPPAEKKAALTKLRQIYAKYVQK